MPSTSPSVADITRPSTARGTGLEVLIEHAIELRIGRQTGDGGTARTVAVPDVHRHRARRFGLEHALERLELVHRGGRRGLRERQRHVLPLHDLELGAQQFLNRIDEEQADDQNGDGQAHPTTARDVRIG
jgi:hypothetical protein